MTDTKKGVSSVYNILLFAQYPRVRQGGRRFWRSFLYPKSIHSTHKRMTVSFMVFLVAKLFKQKWANWRNAGDKMKDYGRLQNCNSNHNFKQWLMMCYVTSNDRKKYLHHWLSVAIIWVSEVLARSSLLIKYESFVSDDDLWFLIIVTSVTTNFSPSQASANPDEQMPPRCCITSGAF